MKASSKNIKYMLVSSALFINILISGFLVIPVTGIQATQSDILNDPVAYNPEANESASRADNVDQGAALQKFVESVADGNSSTVRGIFVENVLEYPVVQQPATQPGFVSTAQDVVTEFSMARMGPMQRVIGLVQLLFTGRISGFARTPQVDWLGIIVLFEPATFMVIILMENLILGLFGR